MLTTWLNTQPNLDYQPESKSASPDSSGLVSGLFQMKFSTRIDTDLPAERLFDSIGNFETLERMLIGRGASVSRIDPSNDPSIGMGWNIRFDWRGKPRHLRLAVTRFDRPEQMTMDGRSDALELAISASVVPLSRARSRLICETEVKPRNMRARLMLQTAKLGKGQLDRRYQRRIEEFVSQMCGTGR
ncbi:hypothetical protein PANO111632_11095 [Paracoccus nototheniae]